MYLDEKKLGETSIEAPKPIEVSAPQAPVLDNPHNADAFIQWLERQPSDRGYCFAKPQSCLIAQWLLHCGCAKYMLPSGEIEGATFRGAKAIASQLPSTFGDALHRALLWYPR